MQLERNTTERLYDWGDWARKNDVSLGAIGTLGRLNGSTVPTLTIADDDAEQIDRIVAKLISRDKEMGTAVKLYYFRKFKYRNIAFQLKINKDKAQRLVKSGTAWIDGALTFQKSQVA